jgi:K+/H+ antiporter YhaU regulatory subunit KhtT
MVGKSLGEVQFRSRTGGTVLAVQRHTKEIVAPEADTIIQAGDVLTVIAPPEAIEHTQGLNLTILTGPPPQTTE